MLAFIHVGTRLVFCPPGTFKPDEQWMVSRAHSFLEQAREAGVRVEYLTRDRDSKYITAFDDVFKAAGCRVDPTAPRAPSQNAFIERWVKSIRVECLNFFIVFGKRRLDHLVSSYANFYYEMSPHQAKENRPLSGKWSDEDPSLGEDDEIVCHESLGGILRHYEHVAA